VFNVGRGVFWGGKYSMKIAIVGSSGYIARFLLEHLKQERSVKKLLTIDVTEEAEKHLDLRKPQEFEYQCLEEIDYVIFTAAISGPDQCAKEFELCWSVNVLGTSYFIKEAIKRQCKVLFFSSDAVFGDVPGMIYTEESETCADTPYGKMKKAIEDEFRNSPFFKAIRLAYVVSAKDRFVGYCLNCLNKGEEAEVFHPFYRNCITVCDVISVIWWLLQHWSAFQSFVLNVAGSELVSRVRIADEINRIYGGNLQYTISNPGKEFFINRPQITQMKSLYITKEKILEDESFTEKIKRELEEA